MVGLTWYELPSRLIKISYSADPRHAVVCATHGVKVNSLKRR